MKRHEDLWSETSAFMTGIGMRKEDFIRCANEVEAEARNAGFVEGCDSARPLERLEYERGRKDENEACAKIAESYCLGSTSTANWVSASIRARVAPPKPPCRHTFVCADCGKTQMEVYLGAVQRDIQ